MPVSLGSSTDMVEVDVFDLDGQHGFLVRDRVTLIIVVIAIADVTSRQMDLLGAYAVLLV